MHKLITLVSIFGSLWAAAQAGSYGLPYQVSGNVVYDTVAPVATYPAVVSDSYKNGPDYTAAAVEEVVFPESGADDNGPRTYASLAVQSFEFGGPTSYSEQLGPIRYAKGKLPIVQSGPVAKVYLPAEKPAAYQPKVNSYGHALEAAY